MNNMLNKVYFGSLNCRAKVNGFFRRAFKEEKGGAELIATLIIIGIVLILAFAFKDKLIGLVKNLWNSLLKNGNENTAQGDVVEDWT